MSSSEVLPRLPLAEPSIGGNAAAYLAECLDSTYVSSIGAFVDRFEREFADVVGTRFAVACNSGTAALHLAFTALGVGPGDDVLVPTLTFVASANPVRYLGATPVLTDSEPATLNVDPESWWTSSSVAREPASVSPGRSRSCTSSVTPPTWWRSSTSPRALGCR